MPEIFNKQKDYELLSVDIIKPLQGGGYRYYDVSNKMMECSIYQDIFNSVLSGKVVLADSSDMMSEIPLTGNEFFRLGIRYPDTSLTGLLDSTLSFAESNGLIENVDAIISAIDFNKLLGDFLGGFLISFLQQNVASLGSIQNLFSTILGMTDFKRKNQYHLFRIYKADNTELVNKNSKIETLRLISPEYVWNLQTKFQRNFTQEQVSSIVAAYFTELKNFFADTHPEIYRDKLKQDALTIEETSGLVNFSGVRGNPFTLINSLSDRAISNLDNSANYVFFQNNIGFNFRSLASIFSQNNQLQFFAKNPNISEDKQAAFKLNAMAFEKMNRLQNFDVINNLREGLYGSNLVSIDPLKGRWYKKDFKLTEEFFKYIGSQNDPSAQNLRIEDNFEGLDKPTARQMLAFSTKDHDITPFLKALDSSMIDEKIEHVSQLRASQFRLLEQCKTYVRLPGHPSINAGLKCQFNMPNFNAIDQGVRNKYMQGDYIITACAHHISRFKYEVDAEIVKTDFYSKIAYQESSI